ncbi:Methyl-accepting chemotaxis protein, partial [uncultured Microcoleus sp.]
GLGDASCRANCSGNIPRSAASFRCFAKLGRRCSRPFDIGRKIPSRNSRKTI